MIDTGNLDERTAALTHQHLRDHGWSVEEEGVGESTVRYRTFFGVRMEEPNYWKAFVRTYNQLADKAGIPLIEE